MSSPPNPKRYQAPRFLYFAINIILVLIHLDDDLVSKMFGLFIINILTL